MGLRPFAVKTKASAERDRVAPGIKPGSGPHHSRSAILTA
jgi:hypothetical protein